MYYHFVPRGLSFYEIKTLDLRPYWNSLLAFGGLNHHFSLQMDQNKQSREVKFEEQTEKYCGAWLCMPLALNLCRTSQHSFPTIMPFARLGRCIIGEPRYLFRYSQNRSFFVAIFLPPMDSSLNLIMQRLLMVVPSVLLLGRPFFDSSNPWVWFIRVQAYFHFRKIISKIIKFSFVVTQLSTDIASEVVYLINPVPTDCPYDQ